MPAFPVRVRFAPSPTGFLHVGGARTAIFNWLFARRKGGTFVLRIEDTDAARSSEPMVAAILDAMAWLGLDPDEGPFFQSAGRDRHSADCRRLLEAHKAYRCFCPQDRRDPSSHTYPRRCRRIPSEESERRATAGESFAVRFLVPDGPVDWNDAVHGTCSVDGDTLEDFVLLRSDGSPTYMLSVVSDDVAMEITHVIRGDDHLSNTPKQILLYRALDRRPPVFAHLPLILGEDRKRLSKRHGAVSVLDYRDRGYLSQAVFNFLALLGWSPGENREKMTGEEMIAAFDLSAVNRAGAVFDLEKLDWLNGEYINETPEAELVEMVRTRLERAGVWRSAFAGSRRGWYGRVLSLLRSRCRTLEDFVEYGRPFFDPTDDFPYEPKAVEKHLKGDGLADHLRTLASRLGEVEPWSADRLEHALRAVAEESGVSAAKLIHPTRLAVTGKGVSPGLFEVLELIGRERSVARLERLAAHVEAGGSSAR